MHNINYISTTVAAVLTSPIAFAVFNTTAAAVMLWTVFDEKYQLVLACQSSWPTYIYHHEDLHLRKQKWKSKYDENCIVQWDDTNVPFIFKPSQEVKNQRLTYSSYSYGMN